MISGTHLTVDFGNRLLFDDISFVVGDKERVALVGKNGAGKSTLLKIIAGLESPSSGTIARTKGMEIGYLPQVMLLRDEKTLLEEAESVFADFKEKQEQLEALAKEMAHREDHDSEDYHTLIERYATLSERLAVMGTGNYLADIEKTLIGLGFERSDFARPTHEFSGGWRMRIELAKILLAKPDLLLLDEPTNHLDIESIEWLEQFIKSSGSALILVSHDRAFLDAVTKRTLELEMGKHYDYKVCYSEYLVLREERLEMQRRAYENQQKAIEDTEAFIERFRYKASKSVQVQSRIKQLAKIERIVFDEIDRSAIHFRFPAAERSGDYPLIVEGLAKSYGEHCVFSGVNFTIRRGEKVAFVGKNGAGKSTLIKCIMQQVNDYKGTLKVGHNVSISYFSQNRAHELDTQLTVRETIDRAATGEIRTRINDMLGAFMFGGEAGDKPVAVLSGGERSRLAILLLLLEPSNMLILDEPTNHLDIRSKEVLKEAIATFNGTVIVVSHDRYFLSGLVEKVYEFGHGKAIEHLGGIEEYLHKMRERGGIEEATPSIGKGAEMQASTPAKEVAKLSYQEHKEQQKRVRSILKQAEEAEREVTRLEALLVEFETQLAGGGTLPTDALLYSRYERAQKELETAMERWEIAELAAAQAKAGGL